MGTRTMAGALLVIAAVQAARVPVRAQESRPAAVPKAASVPAVGVETAGKAADRLADLLKRFPAKPSRSVGRAGLYLIDVERGGVTLIADEPAPGLTHCGSARWSEDGTRILYDATPGNRWNRTRLGAIVAGDGRPERIDLGAGNCPSPSPDGRRIAFLLNTGAVPGAEAGVWVMQADGSGRRRLGSYGWPFWSPDGRKLLIVSFADPCTLALMDVETGEDRPVVLPKQRVDSVPSWAGADTLVAVLGAGPGDTLAFLDVADPGQVKVKEVLWTRDRAAAIDPAYPVFSAAARRGVFVGVEPRGMAVYALSRAEPAAPRRLEPEGFDKTIADLALSPGGRYVIFCSDRR